MKRQPYIKNKVVQFWYIILQTTDLVNPKIFKQNGEDYLSEVLKIKNKETAYRKSCKIYSRFLEILAEDLLNGDEFKLPTSKKGSFFIKEEKPNYAKYVLNPDYSPSANIFFNIDIDVFIRTGKHYFIKPRKHLKWDAEEKIKEGFKYLKDV